MSEFKLPIVNIIGCGRLGKTLCKLWHDGNYINLQFVKTRSYTSALLATQFIGAGAPCDDWLSLKPANIWLIATPDNAIALNVEALKETGLLRQRDVVCHFSGCLSHRILNEHGDLDIATVSAHPIKSFSDPKTAITRYAGTYCALSGMPKGLAVMRTLLMAIESRVFILEDQYKPLYHAATVYASNFINALLDASEGLLMASGVPDECVHAIACYIAEDTICNILEKSPLRALTGPVKRSDTETIAAHEAALMAHAPELNMLYQKLSAYLQTKLAR